MVTEDYWDGWKVIDKNEDNLGSLMWLEVIEN